MTWKPYLNDRLIKECDGFYVIKPSEHRNVIPLACPVCEYLLRSMEDERSYHQYNCCEHCETFWARPNSSKWKEGWRPTKEQVMEKLKDGKKMTVNMLF